MAPSFSDLRALRDRMRRADIGRHRLLRQDREEFLPRKPPEVLPATRRQVRSYLDSLDVDTIGAPMRASISRAFEALWQPEGQPAPAPKGPVLQVIRDQFHRLYYHVSDRTWKNTHYRGVLTYKCPTDMWMYAELIHQVKPGLIVETGTFRGGSALFLADHLQLLGRGRVISIDIDVQPDRPAHPRLTYVTGSSVDEEVLALVRDAIDPALPVLVILDSDHSAAHVAKELAAYAPLVTRNSYLIVEDTNVNGHPAAPLHGPGPFEAVQDFLVDNADYAVDHGCERYFLTQNPSGYLKRISPRPPLAQKHSQGDEAVQARRLLGAGRELDAATPMLDAARRLTFLGDAAAPTARVVLVLDSYQVGGYFAGIRTAVQAAARLSERMQRPLHVVVAQTPGVDSGETLAADEITSLVREVGSPEVASSLTFDLPGGVPGSHGPEDVWMVTYWTTAWALRVLSEEGLVDPARVVYLIQDFEPGFYPWGPLHAKALSTYSAGFVPLVNSASLAGYLAEQVGIEAAAVFAPQLDRTPLVAAAKRWTPPRAGELRVLFYARPSKPRNLYTLGVDALRLWLRDQSNDLDIVVRCAGEDLAGDVDLGPGVRVEQLGKTSYEEYYDLLAETDLGLALMLSPHPGHLALELPMAGIPTVTNEFGGHRAAWSPDLTVAPADAGSIAAALRSAATSAQAKQAHIPGDVLERLGGSLDAAVAVVADRVGGSRT